MATSSMSAAMSWMKIRLPLLHTTLLISVLSTARPAQASPVPSVSDTINNYFPTANATGGPASEIQCYAIPYGGIGLLSHLLTYWAVIWIAYERTPLWPWHPLDKSIWDTIMAIVTLCTCIPLAAVSMHRCRNEWQFVLIAVWKLIFSVTQACVVLHQAYIIRFHPERRQVGQYRAVGGQAATAQMRQTQWYSNQPYTAYGAPQPRYPPPQALPERAKIPAPLYWLILYLFGTITGMTGLLDIVVKDFGHDQNVRWLTYGFGIAIVLLSVGVGAYHYKRHYDMLEQEGGGGALYRAAVWHTFGGFFKALIVCFGAFSAFYSDLVLGAIAYNWPGFPSEDNSALYWAWFVAKRIPLLSH